MALLKIITAPDPILKQRATVINQVDDSIRELMDNMLETMYHDRGVGLAANQVGVLKRVVVVDLQEDDDKDRGKDFYPLFLANPEIIEASSEMVEATEGCMSLPDQKINVIRPDAIKVKYLDYHNKLKELEVDGWLARAIQHEIDHLEGKLLIDYLSSLKRNVVVRKLNKLKKIPA